MKKSIISILTALTMVTLSPLPDASAEGVFNTSVSGVRDGFMTRKWNDKNMDPTATSIRATGCRNQTPGSPGHVDFTLRRERSFRPDTIEGAKNFNNCYRGSAQHSWGRQQAGTFYAQIGTYEWNHVSISGIEVKY